MRRTGFTLIEMMIALSISAFMVASIIGMLYSVWTLAKDSSDELQAALHARNIREQLFYNLRDSAGMPLGFGLVNATNFIYTSASGITAYHATNAMPWSVSGSTDCQRYAIDTTRTYPTDYLGGESPFEYVYLKVTFGTTGKPGAVAYYDRLIVPKFGVQSDMEDFFDVFGGDREDD